MPRGPEHSWAAAEPQGGLMTTAKPELEIRLVFSRDVWRQPFGRVLVGGRFVELGRAKPSVPLAVYLGQLALCAENRDASPAIRCAGDATFGGRLYRAFSMSTWPRWAAPFEGLRVEGAWPPWRLDRGWLRPKLDVDLRVLGACQTDDEWLGWRDEQRIDNADLWQVLTSLVQQVGWTLDDLDPRLCTQYATHDPAGKRVPSVEAMETDTPSPQQDLPVATKRPSSTARPVESLLTAPGRNQFGDLIAAYPNRSEFMAAYSPPVLFDHANHIRTAGLSLNMLCQQYADHRLQRIVEEGTALLCLFLDPAGDAIAAREQEEQMAPGQLATLTTLNMDSLRRLRDRLDPTAAERVQIGVYNETIRFNLTLLDDTLVVVQPYLPGCRGIESPTFVVQRGESVGLYDTFERTFDWIQQRSTLL